MIRGLARAIASRLSDEEQDADGTDDQPRGRHLAQDVHSRELPDLIPEIAAAHRSLPAEVGQLIIPGCVAVQGLIFGPVVRVRLPFAKVGQVGKDG